jgi:hypothetical protein
MSRLRLASLLLVALCCPGCRGCGARGGLPPEAPPLKTDRDGVKRYELERGPFKAFYDQWGRLERIERDSNGDGKVDQISHHAGEKEPALIEIDSDFDGNFDRWEYYDHGRLVKIGAARHGSAPDMWSCLDAQGREERREYDDDHDGKVESVHHLVNGHLARVEVDTDRDGRFDRWQLWSGGRLVGEELDTDGDGRPDREIRYRDDGRIEAIDRVPAH